MVDSLDIAEVARRTGLTSRALRFYEARGLLRPLRSASGRRHYGPGELERINHILALKRAGLSLSRIAQLTHGEAADLAVLIDDQLVALDLQARRLAETRALLKSIKSRIERSEPIDVATFCSLIEAGERTMSKQAEDWRAVSDRYLGDEARADFARVMPAMPEGLDHADYSEKWRDLGARIKAALPLDPDSPAARAFLDEWKTLLAPFTAIATPAMMTGVSTMYDNMGAWQGQSSADPGFDSDVWSFVKAAALARNAA